MDAPYRTDFKTVDKRDEIRAVFGYLSGENDDVPVVLDREKPYGVLNEKGLMRSRLSPSQRIDAYVVGTRVLPPDATVEDALEVLATSRIPHVPVATGEGRVLGVVHAIDVLAKVESDRTAEHLMIEAPILSRKASVGEAMHHFHAVAASALPIVDESGRVSGILRRRDLFPLATDARAGGGRKGALGERLDVREPPVEGYVDGRFEEVRPTASFDQVREALARTGFAVVAGEDHKPRGMLTPEGVVARLEAV